MVRMANAIVANTPRRVDFVHLPMTKRTMPTGILRALQRSPHRGSARVPRPRMEGRTGRDARRRAKPACAALPPSFGISHYCGYGRDTVEQMPELLDDLRAGADALSSG